MLKYICWKINDPCGFYLTNKLLLKERLNI